MGFSLSGGAIEVGLPYIYSFVAFQLENFTNLVNGQDPKYECTLRKISLTYSMIKDEIMNTRICIILKVCDATC